MLRSYRLLSLLTTIWDSAGNIFYCNVKRSDVSNLVFTFVVKSTLSHWDMRQGITHPARSGVSVAELKYYHKIFSSLCADCLTKCVKQFRLGIAINRYFECSVFRRKQRQDTSFSFLNSERCLRPIGPTARREPLNTRITWDVETMINVESKLKQTSNIFG